MKPALIIFLMASIIMAIIFLYPINGEGQYFGMVPIWTPWPVPIFSPWAGTPFFLSTFTASPLGYFGIPVLPMPVSSPFLIEPGLRIANTPATLSIPPLSPTAAPLTVLLNLIDPVLLADNIAVLTTNYPLVYELLVTTFQLPI